MKVMKFGGTSVGSAVNIRKVREILAEEPGDVVVVVSALGGITDQILRAARMAAAGDPLFREELTAIRERHLEVTGALSPCRKERKWLKKRELSSMN